MRSRWGRARPDTAQCADRACRDHTQRPDRPCRDLGRGPGWFDYREAIPTRPTGVSASPPNGRGHSGPSGAAVAAPAGHAVEWTGGIFVNISTPRQIRRPRLYRPSERATGTPPGGAGRRPAGGASLLAFVNRWGVLGVGLGTLRDTATLLRRPPLPSPPTDSVWATRRAFAALQASFRWLRALQARRWSSPEIPSLAVPGRAR